MVNDLYADTEIAEKEGAIKRLTKIHKRKTIDSDSLENVKMEIRAI